MIQTSLTDEIIVDNFAGGGGTSTGIELVTGRPVTIAINHDPDAIAMHTKNHPYTEHYCESVWDIQPQEACRGRKVALVWLSPDCKHFSKAKGGSPVNKNVRGLAWVTLRWALEAHPRVIMLENVEEFKTWGPVFIKNEKMYPDPVRAGETFIAFVRMLSAGIENDHPGFLEACEFLKISPDSEQAQRLLQGLGYEVDFKELRACDFGAPTIRKRFFLIARCDGKPIVWPKPTHGSQKGLQPYRTAADILDWSLPCPSIFESGEEIYTKHGVRAVRPLADNTLRRVARGLDKFVLNSAKPFIIPVGYGERSGQKPRISDIDSPLNTIVSTAKQYLVSPSMVQVNHAGDFRGQSVQEPLQTITGKLGFGVSAPVLAPYMTAIGQTGFKSDRCRSVEQPINTTVSKAESCLVTPCLIQYHQEQSEHVRGQSVQEPIMTIDGSNRYAFAAGYLTKYFSGEANGQRLADPLHTITTKDREGLTLAYMSKYYAGGCKSDGNPVTAPLNTITAIDHNALVATYISKFYATGIGQSIDEPLHTVTTSPGHFGQIRTYLTKWNSNQPLHNWSNVRALLNEYCGYSIKEDEVLILEIDGTPYFISDIGLRMLIPSELYAANGFPLDYIIDFVDVNGKRYSKAKQVARCGNAVPPVFSAALVRANLPELCIKETLTSMRELDELIAI